MKVNYKEKFWCWWLSRYIYKTDRQYRGMNVYVDIADAQFELTPEQEAKLEKR